MPFQQDDLEYYADNNIWFDKSTLFLLKLSGFLSGGIVPCSVRYKKISKPIHLLLLLSDICSRLELDKSLDKSLEKKCELVERNLILRNNYLSVIDSAFYFPYLLIFILIIWPIIWQKTFPLFGTVKDINLFSDKTIFNLGADIGAYLLAKFFAILLFMILFWISTTIPLVLINKVLFNTLDRYFASSLAIQTLLYLLVDLNYSEVMYRSDMRLQVIRRMNYMIRCIRLLSLQMSYLNKDSSMWIEEHFRAIEMFVRERQRWAMAPVATTRDDLEEDFRYLAYIFITNQYGEFHWSPQLPSEEKKQPVTKANSWQSLWRPIIALLPLIIFFFVLWKQEILKNMGIPPNVISLISISWLLLLIDRFLNLGIIESIITTAKGIRDINK